MPEPIGGVNIYGKYTVLPKEGNLNVIKYNGLTIKFPNQTEYIKTGQSSRPPFLSTGKDGRTEVLMRDAEIFGSEKNDLIESWGIGNIFRLKEGGADTLITHAYQDGNYGPEKRNTADLDDDDVIVQHVTLYNDDDPKKGAYAIYTAVNKIVDGEVVVEEDFEIIEKDEEDETPSANPFLNDSFYDDLE